MSLKLKNVIAELEKWAPLQYQENYDNSGLLIGDKEMNLSSALICLDCTEQVIEEAISSGANLVIAHHPLIFSGLKKLVGENYVERTVIKAIKNDIAVYAIHTNLDNMHNGVNAKITELMGIQNPQILFPKKGLVNIGSGMIGELKEEMSALNFMKMVKETFGVEMLRYTNILKDKVNKIAVCGGSGSFLLPQAIEQGADVFVSSDFKYHQFFDSENQIVIVDIGHYEAEKFTKELIYDFLREKFPTFVLRLSNIKTNPVNYL